MRSSRQALYDRLYYKFELDLVNLFAKLKACGPVKGFRDDDGRFERFFRETVRPYWKQFGVRAQRYWFRHYYQATGKLDHRFIPHNLHHRYVIPFFDDPVYERQLEDKNLYSMIFPDQARPETMFKYFAPNAFSRGPGSFCGEDFAPIGRDEALARVLAGGSFILKPTRDTGEGMDIKVFSAEDGRERIKALLDSYARVDFIVQRLVRQHADMA